ncbi:MAG: preprotein translocase subunit TatA [Halolamina sp.]|uniref:preprotein translocase subunit TatA n=1 Tax=Halolamina sp. TaxID=1940283 RepID=UPI002FC34B43
MVPLFGGVPGAPELLIILLMLLLMLAVPLVIAVGLFLLGRWTASSDVSEAELETLRNRIDELEAELADEAGDGDSGDSETDPDAGN